MSLDITIKKDYILVEPKEGADFREIRRGIARLIYVPQVPDKNDIWVFRKGVGKLSHDDLYKLRDIIQEIHSKDSRGNKTALVIESEVQSIMAEAFTQIAKDLPHEFRVFSSLQDAEAWIKN